MNYETIIIYHSVQGNTQRVAQIFANKLKADLFRINSTDTINKNLALMTPKIVHQMLQPWIFNDTIEKLALDNYHRIILGCPCWNYTYSPVIGQFLEKANYQEKQVGLLLTHGGEIGSTIAKFQGAMRGGTFLGAYDFPMVKNISDQELTDMITLKIKNLY